MGVDCLTIIAAREVVDTITIAIMAIVVVAIAVSVAAVE